MEYEEEHEEGEEELEGIHPTPYDHHHQLPNNSSSPMSMPAPQPPPSLARTSSINSGRKPAAGVRYRECLKNHAVGMGGHAVDGCCEFMAAGEEGSLDGLKCAACGCHRNFHRKEADGDTGAPSAALAAAAAAASAAYHGPFSPYYRTPAGYLHVAPHHRPPPTLALPSTSGGGAAHSRDDQEDMSNPSSGGGGAAQTPTGSTKKRFRTKFTVEQKERMLALAERLGWRIQKQDEAMVQQFCAEMGVKRHVLKVWMHNNKHTLGKKP